MELDSGRKKLIMQLIDFQSQLLIPIHVSRNFEICIKKIKIHVQH